MLWRHPGNHDLYSALSMPYPHCTKEACTQTVRRKKGAHRQRGKSGFITVPLTLLPMQRMGRNLGASRGGSNAHVRDTGFGSFLTENQGAHPFLRLVAPQDQFGTNSCNRCSIASCHDVTCMSWLHKWRSTSAPLQPSLCLSFEPTLPILPAPTLIHSP